MAVSQFNLTRNRIRALRIIQQKPNINAAGLAYDLYSDPADRYSGPKWPQQATRMGAKVAKPLIEAGLVKGKRADVGWMDLSLTEAGLAQLQAATEEE